MAINEKTRAMYAAQGITRESTIKRLEKIKAKHLHEAKHKPVVAYVSQGHKAEFSKQVKGKQSKGFKTSFAPRPL